MSKYKNYQELRACDIEDLIQDVLNSLYQMNKKIPRNDKFKTFDKEKREYLESLLQKLKEAYSVKGLDPENYIAGVKNNIKKREEKLLDRDSR